MASSKGKYRFKGHEKFILREGWLNKGLTVINNDEHAFSDKLVCDRLGVGKNMANSIRYWLKAFNLMEDVPRHGARLTTLGTHIYENDRYFEDYFTLWLLHSNLARNINEATTWYMFFNKCELDEFNKDEVVKKIVDEVSKNYSSKTLKAGVKADIDVLLNMYCAGEDDEDDPEDKNVSPLSTLGLIVKKNDTYYKVQPDIRKLNEKIILYEILNIFGKEKSISIDTIADGEKGLSKIFNLSRVVVNEYLDKLEEMKYIKVIRTAGLDSVVKTTDLTADDVISEYYTGDREGM